MDGAAPLLEIVDLATHFYTRDGVVRAVDGVSCVVHPGETLAVVGESGSGKSVTALSILRLVPSPPGRVVRGSIRFAGEDLLGHTEAEMRRIRGNSISMVFQEPMTSLNPVMTVGEQLAEPFVIHHGASRTEAMRRAEQMLAKVHIPAPQQRAHDYPHQLSGGMRQRVMIAMALACRPKLLVADEPTTALDVTIQAQILELLAELKRDTGAAVILITHDLGVVAETADRVVVMYAGRHVETASVIELFDRPLHPYTRGLMGAIPWFGGRPDEDSRVRLAEIPGMVPSLREPIVGCAFAPRCRHANDLCKRESPGMRELIPGHAVACHRAEERLEA